MVAVSIRTLFKMGFGFVYRPPFPVGVAFPFLFAGVTLATALHRFTVAEISSLRRGERKLSACWLSRSECLTERWALWARIEKSQNK